MASILGFLSRNYQTVYPAKPAKEANALKFGILGAARIAPIALINPARSHPGVIIEAVAARDPARARAFATKYGIPKTFTTYQELLEDPTIDVVYNPLPNGLHYEWTIKALNAGKHVLLEKPATNTVEEATKIFALAKEKNLVLLEAFHYRFHPAIQTVKSLVDAGTIGKPKGVEVEMGAPSIMIPAGDIRRDFSLGGGATMDMGGYVINASRYVLGTDPEDLLHIVLNTYPEDKRVDRSIRVQFEFPNDVTAAVYADLGLPKMLGVFPRVPIMTFKIDGEGGSIYLNNFVGPSFYHSITVTKGKKDQAKHTTMKAYTFEHIDKSAKGEVWWTTYRYMLEAFVDKVQGRTPQTWVTAEDTIANMKAIEMVYEGSGLGIRPASSYE